MKRPKRYVCPENGQRVKCATCEHSGPHVREELVQPGEPAPVCDLHKIEMVPA